MGFSKEELLKMHEYLVFSRKMGEKIIEYIFAGKIAGAIHPPLGQEAIAAGLIMAAENAGIKTHSVATHRNQAVMAKRAGLDRFLGELLCRQTGVCGGLAGEYHMCDFEVGLLPAQGALGGTWPYCVGYAWALKNDGKDDVVIAIYGDGACSEGATFEAMNLAALFKVPVVFVIENNGIAMTTPLEKESPVENLAVRAQASGMKGITVDGNDVVAVTEALQEAIQLAKKGEPNVVELKTTRWEGHYVGDDQSVYRDLSFRENLDEICPVKNMETRLIELGYANEAYIQKVHEEQEKLMSDGFAKAYEAPIPTKEQVLDYNKIYSNEAGGEI